MSSQCWYYSSVHFRTPSSHAFHILFHLTVNNNNIRRIRESSYYCPILILDVLWWPLCHSGYGELASSNIHFLFTKPYTTNTPSFLWNVTCPVYSYHNVNIAGCKWVLIFECSGTTGKYSEARCTCRLSTTPLQNVWELLQCNSFYLIYNLQRLIVSIVGLQGFEGGDCCSLFFPAIARYFPMGLAHEYSNYCCWQLWFKSSMECFSLPIK